MTMTTIAKTFNLAQVFRTHAEKPGPVNNHALVKLLKNVRQCPDTVLSGNARNELKDNFNTIESRNANLSGTHRNGGKLLRDMIWHVSEQRQGIAQSHSGKVTTKEISTLKMKVKALKSSVNHSKSDRSSFFELNNRAGKDQQLAALEANVAKIKKKFISSEVNQGRPNMNKAKSLEALSRDLEFVSKKVSDAKDKIADIQYKTEQGDKAKAYKIKHMHDPKVEKSFLGDGNS